MKKGILSLINFVLILIALGVFFILIIPIKSNTFAHIVLSPVEKRFHKKIEFGTSRIWLPANISLEDVSIIGESGRLYYCKTFNLRYNLGDLLFKKREFFFTIKDIKLYKNIGLLDSIADMLVITTMPDIEFNEIDGTLRVYKNAILVKNFYTCNDNMRIKGNGWIYNDGVLDCNVSFSFSKTVTNMIPDAVKSTLLTHEDEEWMGITLKVKGNYKKPSLHITGDMLKLNIVEGPFINK